MNILWVQDYNVFAYPGGAERNDCRLIHEGIRRSHNITMDFDSHWDLALISNCVTIDNDILESILSQKKHIFFMHDYIFCKYRLFFPCIEKCYNCKFADIWKKRFLSSKAIIYLSPLHKEYHERFIPELKDIPNFCVPSTIDPHLFNPFRQSRIKNSALCINSLLPYKGANRLIEFISKNPNIKFQIVSPNPSLLPLPPNAFIIAQHLPYKDIITLLETSEFYVELPETPQPFNRTCMEAKLAGCKVITNELMGAISYPWFNDRKEAIYELLNAPRTFWKGLEHYGN